MKKLIFLFFLISVCNLALAKKERISICDPRVPSIELNQAIQLVMEHHKKGGNKGNAIFIDEARLQCSNNNLFWLMGYRLKAYESGHMYVTVRMDGTVKLHSTLKDG